MKPRVLIIGSGGMLGCDLWQGLRKSYEVYGADLVANRTGLVARSQGNKVTSFYKCDITDAKNVTSVMAAVRPEVVIHAAAWTDVDGCERDPRKAYSINTDGTTNVAFACRNYDAALIYISTDFVFNGRNKDPYRESDKTAPLSVYADSKLKGENAVKKILKNYFIIRTSWLYGKCGKNFVDTIIDKAKRVPVLKVVDDQIGSPTYTKDLAKALHVLLGKIFTNDERRITNDAQGIYHVSNSGAVSWYDYARTILRISGLKIKVDPISSAELGRPAKRPAMSVLNSSKFMKLTGLRLRSWKVALREYLNK